MNKEDIMARGKKKEVLDVIEPVEEITAEEAVDILEEQIAEETEVAKKKGIVKNCGLLNVREAPSIDAKAITQLSANTRVEILGEENGFYKIEGGFVMKDFVEVL